MLLLITVVVDTCDTNLLENCPFQAMDTPTLQVIATIGTESMYAVAIPVTRFVAPGPEVARHTPTLPVERAYPSAAWEAPCHGT